MSRYASKITLTQEDQETLEHLIRSPKTEQRLVFRARLIRMAGQDRTTKRIAKVLKVRPATVSKWRTRFSQKGMAGLYDEPRTGMPRRYDEKSEQRILAKLDEPPPNGYATWNGALLEKTLSTISKHQIWRTLNRHGIQLQRRKSWCLSTDPEFAPKAAEIVGLYLNPPENAVVLSVDEKPSIQALERAQGYLRLPNGRAVMGQAHEYKRHGTTTLFAALNVGNGKVKADHYNRRRRKEFLSFMNDVIKDYPNQEIHVVLDNLKTHKPKEDRWLAHHRNVFFHYTPTHASWLNQVECWFSILSRGALKGTSFTSIRQVREAIDRFIQGYNPQAEPFKWTKKLVHQTPLRKYYADLRK